MQSGMSSLLSTAYAERPVFSHLRALFMNEIGMEGQPICSKLCSVCTRFYPTNNDSTEISYIYLHKSKTSLMFCGVDHSDGP